MADKNLNWAVLGVGVIANEMAQALHRQGKTLYAVANRTHSKAVAFAEKYSVPKVYDAIDDLFTDDAVDVIYLTTPHNTHYPFMKRALENGKHLLVEKSITLNSRELDEMIALAAEKNLVLAEAMTIWHMPLYKTLWNQIARGDFGRVQIITLNFGSFKPYDMRNRFFNMDLAGGALLDIGVYALSIVRSFMAEKPTEILSQWKPSPTGSDEMSTILLKNTCGQLATVHCQCTPNSLNEPSSAVNAAISRLWNIPAQRRQFTLTRRRVPLRKSSRANRLTRFTTRLRTWSGRLILVTPRQCGSTSQRT